MIVIETDIYDIRGRDINEEKVDIANNILNVVGPLFEAEIEESKASMDKMKKERAKVDEDLIQVREKLEELQAEFSRETKRKKLLNRIRQLIEANLTNDTSLKSEVIILLKVIDKLEDNLLDEHIERMIKTISKRFSK
jgi:Skp family chaperone for outer membrane proteins